MEDASDRFWTTLWDRANRRVLTIAGPGACDDHYWSKVTHDPESSEPDAYDVWRTAGGGVVFVEIRPDENDTPIGFPTELLSESLLGSQTLWPARGKAPSYVWWNAPVPARSDLAVEERVLRRLEMMFLQLQVSFQGFKSQSFRAVDLIADPNWRWGFDHGVYCFTRGSEILYVGRALGKTLGERIADHLRSTQDSEWVKVVHDEETNVVVFAVEKEQAWVSASFEAFLITALQSDGFELPFNKRLC